MPRPPSAARIASLERTASRASIFTAIRSAVRDFRRDLVLMWRGGGAAGAREAVLYRTLHRLYRRRKFGVLEHPLLDGGEASTSVEGVEIRPFEDRDWGSLEQAMTKRTIERFRRRLARGRTCFLAWSGERPIGYSWISERVEPEIEELVMPLPNDAVYCWDLYVMPDERNRGVGSALANARLHHARQLGFERAWRVVSPDNAPAMRTSKGWAPGVRTLGEVTVVKLLGRVRARYELSEAGARRDGATWAGRLAAAVGERFLVPARTSPRASLWIAAHAALVFPYLIRGTGRRYRARVQGTQVRVFCVGREDSFRIMLTRLLAGRAQLEGSDGRHFLWTTRQFRPTGADLVAVAIHPWLSAWFRKAGWLVCPEFVRWQGQLSRIPPAKPSRSLNSDLVRITRGGYALEETVGSMRDWEEFQQGMVVPYAVRRFGDEAWIPSSGYLRAIERNGTLLFIRKDGERVAGVCVIRSGAEAWVAAIGVREGELALMRSGAIAAVYSLTIDWAKAHGMRRIDFGRTSAFQLDGIARFKRKWGLSPVRDPLSRLIAIKVDPGQPALRRALEREPFLVETGGALRAFPR